jgi:hypothetical protein
MRLNPTTSANSTTPQAERNSSAATPSPAAGTMAANGLKVVSNAL